MTRPQLAAPHAGRATICAFLPVLAAGLGLLASPATAQQAATHTVKLLTPDTALKAAQASLAHCRQAGHQVAVAVVDRAGVIQVLLRDRFAGAHTVEVATRKAWTAASFRIPTTQLATESQTGQPMSGIRAASQVMAIGGGLPIEAGGTTFGGIGVSGAPGGEADDACAEAGLKAIAEAIEF
jgi:uncharacterized protein GlcG (DUF336 family)